MNDKNMHAFPQPLPPNYGPLIGPGLGQGRNVGQQPWMPNTVHPSSYMSHPGYSSNYQNAGNAPICAPGYPPPMHHRMYMHRYSPYDRQCQNFPYLNVHEGPAHPLNPPSYTITNHFNLQSPFRDSAKDSPSKNALDTFPQSKNPHPAKKKSSRSHEKNGREDMLLSPSDDKRYSETTLATTESCPDDMRSPTSCDKQENFDKSENSLKPSNDSNSHSIEPSSKKCKNNDINNCDTNSEQDSQSFSSVLNSNNQVRKDNPEIHPSYEMRVHNPQFSQIDNMYDVYPDEDGRMLNNLSHNPNVPLNAHLNDSMHFLYHSLSHTMSDVDKLSDPDFSEKRNTSENVSQVPSISSTTPPKVFPPILPSPISEPWDESKYFAPQDDMDTKKVLHKRRKRRKRCKECPGCLLKESCGKCKPCRNERSHKICKMRKCESLKTRKKNNQLINIEDVQPINIEDVQPINIEDVQPINIEDVQQINIEDVQQICIRDVQQISIKDVQSINIGDIQPINMEDVQLINIEDGPVLTLDDFSDSEINKSNSNSILSLDDSSDSEINKSNQIVNSNPILTSLLKGKEEFSKRKKNSRGKKSDFKKSIRAMHEQMELQTKALNEQTNVLQNIAMSLQSITKSLQNR